MSTKLQEKTHELASERQIAKHKILLEDDRMIVTHWVFKPGEQTGWHRHELDYMPIQMSEGRLRFEFPDGSTKDVDYVPRTSSIVKAPLEHNAINVSDVEMVALEIEFKR
jgi:quercetin dioxygenase-like cupin family protein